MFVLLRKESKLTSCHHSAIKSGIRAKVFTTLQLKYLGIEMHCVVQIYPLRTKSPLTVKCGVPSSYFSWAPFTFPSLYAIYKLTFPIWYISTPPKALLCLLVRLFSKVYRYETFKFSLYFRQTSLKNNKYPLNKQVISHN